MVSVHETIVIRHGPRESNFLADYLAKVGLSLPFEMHTFDSPFGEFHSLLQRDIMCPLSLL